MFFAMNATKTEQTLLNRLDEYMNFSSLEASVSLAFYRVDQGLEIVRQGDTARIGYSDLRMLARALSLLAGQMVSGGEAEFEIRETPCFAGLTLMLDCSRNAVPSIAFLKEYLVRMAVMGYSSLQLYTEDTYELEGYPYFGYMRGRFSNREWMELDQFAAEVGIELVPCIQTLAHLGSALRWNCFREYTDIEDILLVDDERTYELIEAMVQTCARCFRSRRIHIGMDEAHLVGLGKYLQSHGYEERNGILCRHLNRVLEICRRHGLKAMMWSDMFFRLADKGGQYYSEDAHISAEVADMVPEEVSLVYWDYYTEEKSRYDRMIQKHQQFHSPILFAGGAWKWRGFAPSNGFSLRTAREALASCREHGISEVILTAWGDNGGEASHLSILPAIQYYAEFCFGHGQEDAWLAERFHACTGENLEDFMLLDLPNKLPGVNDNGRENPSKYLLYQDVMCPLFDRHVREDYEDFYAEAAKRLYEAGARSPRYGYLYETLSTLCALLSKKALLGVRVRQAYQSQDSRQMYKLCREEIPQVQKLAEEFHEAAARQWHRENKPFGWEMLDIRLGGLESRLKSAASRIEAYLEGNLDSLEELEEERLYYDCRPEGEWEEIGLSPYCWHDMVSAGKITL